MNQFTKYHQLAYTRLNAICKAKIIAQSNQDWEGLGRLLKLSEQEYARLQAASRACLQSQSLHYTTKGDFGHLQSTGAVNFGR